MFLINSITLVLLRGELIPDGKYRAFLTFLPCLHCQVFANIHAGFLKSLQRRHPGWINSYCCSKGRVMWFKQTELLSRLHPLFFHLPSPRKGLYISYLPSASFIFFWVFKISFCLSLYLPFCSSSQPLLPMTLAQKAVVKSLRIQSTKSPPIPVFQRMLVLLRLPPSRATKQNWILHIHAAKRILSASCRLAALPWILSIIRRFIINPVKNNIMPLWQLHHHSS